MASAVTECGNVRIITQVVQQPGPQSADVAAASMLGSTSTVSQMMPPEIKNVDTLPKALGAVHIVLGATQISFGIVLTIAQGNLKTLTVKSGIYFWIGILLLFSGSLLVEMEKRKHVWLVRASLIANLLVCVAALIAIVLHATEIAHQKKSEKLCDELYLVYCNHREAELVYGLNSIFIILSLLEISIAITALVTGYKASRQELYRWMIL
ncbi:membrane-spanning 4-domains subfamily A member 12-like [Sceloporus undulatus]|uniref:membrane-spanning 4-domains subfamily A member 12-like n=1 Tax=Sceloporus undulatus TaxID=8520 RepID=UPI001C4ADC0C|nr:membrane-spanning 4-domains subfamily A member 12-like [Sceloporus undulatus]